MKKKKILFICSNMNVGGFQKSLISLLYTLDFSKYEVDLVLTNPGGIFMDFIPKKVNLIKQPYCNCAKINSKELINLLFKNQKIFFYRIMASVFFRLDKCKSAYFSSLTYPKIEKKYDVAIDYCGQSLLYYMVDRINSDLKISFFHSDYKKWDFYKKYDTKYYKKVDYIVTVSEECVNSMKEIFPFCANKISCINNITTKQTIDIFKKNESPYTLHNDDFIKIVSIGRVCKEKGNDIAIQAAQILKKRKVKFVWYVVGPYQSKTVEKWIKEQIIEYDLVNEYILIGQTDNPYDYIDYADIVAHPSRFEGKAVSIDEALLLEKVVVATNFSTVFDQINDSVTGVITEMTGESFANGLLKVIENKSLRDTIVNNLRDKDGNGNEIEKLYTLIEGRENNEVRNIL